MKYARAARMMDMMGTVEWCRSIPRLLFLMLTITQPQFITTIYAAKTRMASARMKWMGVMVISPNTKLTHSRRRKASAANRATELPVTFVTEMAGGCWVQRLVR